MIADQRLLQTLQAVIRHGSYTRAAADLYLSQPTVYQHVRLLERQYGTRLVEQVGKRVRPTEHGRLVAEYARRIGVLTAEMSAILADDESLTAGELVLSAGSTAGEFIFPRICARFQARHPGVRLDLLVINDQQEIDRRVREHEVDLAIHSGGAPAPGLVKRPFLEDDLVLIAPPGHPLADLELIAPHHLAGERLILFGRSGSAVVNEMIHRWLRTEDVDLHVPLTASSFQAIKVAVREGAGVALVSRQTVFGDDDSLVIRSLAGGDVRHFYLISREHGWRSHLLTAFAEFAVSREWEAAVD
jgi:DNA-binding transcriptional LysR family regulator